MFFFSLQTGFLYRRTLTSVLAVCMGLLPVACVAKETLYDAGKRAYNSGYTEMATYYLTQACKDKGLPQAQRAESCYLAATLALPNTKKADPLLWQAVVDAPLHSALQTEALKAVLALNDVEHWFMATGQSHPRYRAIPPGRGEQDDQASNTSETQAEGSQKEDYLAEALYNNQPLRWPASAFPLKIYINPSPRQLPYFTQGYATAVRQAFTTWANALPTGLRYQWVNTPTEADIEVDWQASLGDAQQEGDTVMGHAGITQPETQNGQLTHVRMNLAVLKPTGKPYSIDEMKAVTLHEMGHALGIAGHSSHRADVMYPAATSLTLLSPRDIATIRRLYSSSPGVSPATEVASDGGELAGLRAQVEKTRQLTLNSNNWVDWSNHGKSQYNLAMAMRNQNQSAVAAGHLLRQSLAAFEEAIRLSPSVLELSLNRVRVLQALNRTEDAQQQLNVLQQKNPNNADIYKEQVAVYMRQNNVTRARQALASYLRLRPTETQAAWVQALRARGL